MATNELERAVIEAARKWMNDGRQEDVDDLEHAVRALERYEATQDPTVKEVGWHEVCEGDELLSVKNGKFYPVIKTLKVRKGFEITLSAATITRPTEKEPTATVRRGATGDAMDLLTSVFSSGGN